MAETEELEPQQYQKRYWEDDVPLKDVRESTLRKFVYLGALLFLGFVLAGSLIKFPDEVQLPFLFKANKSEDIYRFPYPVYLTDKYVASGEHIKKGAKLVRITSPEIVTLINNYYEAQQNLVNYNAIKSLSLAQQKEIIAVKINQDRMKISQAHTELTLLESTWKSNLARLEFEKQDAENKLVKNKELYEKKYISAQELRQYESRKIGATDSALSARESFEKEKSSLLSQINQLNLDIVSLGNELSKLGSDSRFDSVQLTNQFNLSASKIKNTFGEFDIADGGLVLKANADGVISFLFEGDKEIPGGSILLKTRYSNALLYSIVASPATLVGKLEQNQQVYLKVATFPAYEWGAAAGHIESISLTPDEKGNYNVLVGIDDPRKMAGKLQSGMNGNATIVLSEKTFFQYFFRSVKRTYYNTTQNTQQ